MQGETSGQLLLASIEGGVNIELGSNFVLTPNVALRHQGMSVSGLTESGDETALRIAEQNYERLEARAGVRFAGDRTFRSGWTLAPSLDLAAVANLADHDGGILASFAVAPDVSFYLPGMQHDDFWGEVVGGLSLARDNTSFSVRIETSVARDDLYDDRAMARFQYKF
jgi:outer membrane autotransporter protein